MFQSLVQIGVPVVFYSLPFLLAYVGWQMWRHYSRSKYLKSLKFTLLEIKIPKELAKTPQAMEIALGAFHQGWDGDNILKELFLGQCRGWFSLELVSIGGEIHFYIWTQKFFKNLIEAQLYAQYPTIEIHEVDDYVHNVPYGLKDSDWKLWGAEFKLGKEDAYPIKTYVNYGLDKPTVDPDESAAQTDPITAMLEYLSSLNPGEQVWIQILIQASKDRFHKPGTLFDKVGWKDQGRKLIEKLMQRDKAKSSDENNLPVLLSPGERRVIEDIERSLSKPGFDCGIRGIYLAKGEIFNPIRIVGLIGSLKQYNSAELNGFRPSWTTGVKYPWQDLFGKKVARMKAVIFDAYRQRSYFYPPYSAQPFVLSAEELATIYHFPGSMAMTPSLQKIESKRGEPPANLPI